MNGEVPSLQPVIKVREHRQVAPLVFQWLQQRRHFVIRANGPRPEFSGIHSEFVTDADEPSRRVRRLFRAGDARQRFQRR